MPEFVHFHSSELSENLLSFSNSLCILFEWKKAERLVRRKFNFLVQSRFILTWLILFFLGLGMFYISSGYGFERQQPLVIPPHAVFHPPFSPKEVDGFCLIQYDHDSVIYYYSKFEAGDGIAVYMDPAKCGFDTATTYPFKLTNVYFYLYDYPGYFVWPVEIKVNIRDVYSNGDTLRPKSGTPPYSMTFTLPADSGYDPATHPNPINLYLDMVFCVVSPFFLEIIYTGQTQSFYPSLVMSDTTDRPDTNYDWLLLKGKYNEWSTAWVNPVPGRAIMRITGYPQAIDCDICWYWMPKTSKAPSGLPDFDQYQFGSDSVALDGPAAIANCLSWLNSIPSITKPDSLIRLLSSYLHTNPSAGGGTLVDSIKTGLDSLFSGYGLSLYDTISHNPTFSEMKDSLENSVNIVLLVGLWQMIDDTWYRIGGHYVSMAGECYGSSWLAISDPAVDHVEAGGKGRILPPHDPHPIDHSLHNTKGFVSHDVYVSDTLSVGPDTGLWNLKDYYGESLPWLSQFEGQNFQPEQLPYAHTYDSTKTLYAVAEYAIMILKKPTLVPEEEVETPKVFELFPSYPNPFNNQTVIRYTLSRPTNVSLTIYNLLGQKVRTLVKNEEQSGLVTVKWNGKDDRGRDLSSGVYFYQLKTGEFTQTKRMVLLK
jgi:hypothetical protein